MIMNLRFVGYLDTASIERTFYILTEDYGFTLAQTQNPKCLCYHSNNTSLTKSTSLRKSNQNLRKKVFSCKYTKS